MSAMNTQHAYDILTMQKEEKNKDMLILIVMIAVAAIGMGTLYMLWQNQDMLTQMGASMNSLGAAIAQQAKQVVDSNVSRIVVQ